MTLAPALLAQGRWKTLDEWSDALPLARKEASVWLTYWLGISQIARNPPAARKLLQRAYDEFTAKADFMGAAAVGFRG